jgi:peptide/nickel transport system substrate-binding protein
MTMAENPMTHFAISNELGDAIKQKDASRRDTLKMLMAAGLGATLGGSYLFNPTSSAAQTPKSGGHLRVAGYSSSTADTLDPAKGSTAVDYIRCCASYNRLTVLDENGQLQLELADQIESSDAKTWHIKLKSGVRFHNGRKLSSADVVFSVRRHLDKTVGSKVNSIAKQIEDITATDDLTAKIVLAAPNADLPTILALQHFLIVADGTVDFSKGVGTGPFVLDHFEPGVQSHHSRNPNYFKATGPHIDSFELFAIADDTARVNALLAGEVDVVGQVNPRSIRVIEADGGAVAVVTKSATYTNLNIRIDLEPGSKAGFIEGMKYLIDRKSILSSALRGLGELGNDQPVSSTSRYHNPNVKPREFDPDRAKSFFQKAGLMNTEIPIVASDAALSSVDMATTLQRAGEGVGLKLFVNRVPSDGYWSNYWLKAPVHFGSISPRPTPDILFSLLYQSSAPWNESRYKSEMFDKMLLEARGMQDEAKRTEIYWSMQEMVANEAGTIIPAYISDIAGLSKKVKGWKASPLGELMGYAFPEHVWIEG